MRYKFLILIFLASLAGAPVQAQVPPLEPFNLNGEYRVAWNGIKIGRIKLRVSEDTFGYKMGVDTKSGGIARLVSDEKTYAYAEGHRGEAAPYVASRFESRPQGDHEGVRVAITYDAEGKILTRKRTPEDDPGWRPRVPREQENTATDPITAGFIVRKMLRGNMALNIREAIVRTYDGARLAEMQLKIISPARVEVMGEYRDAINTIVTRTPIAGYTPKELKKFKAGDPIIHLYFSADGKFIPIRATVTLKFGELSATLVKIE